MNYIVTQKCPKANQNLNYQMRLLDTTHNMYTITNFNLFKIFFKINTVIININNVSHS